MKLIILTTGQPTPKVTTWAVLKEDIREHWHKHQQAYVNTVSILSNIEYMLEEYHWHRTLINGFETVVIDFQYIEGFIFDEYAKENDR